MPKIKKMIDNGGNVTYPITITDGIYDTDGNQRLSTTLTGKASISDIPTVMSGSGSGHKGGLTPDTSSTAGTSKYLKENGTWSTISLSEERMKSFGYGTCSTAADTEAKTVSISDFILVKYGIVNVTFQNGIEISNPTLNVSGTGAKPIFVDGSALTDNTVEENATLILQYDGTNWNIVGSSVGATEVDPYSGLVIDLGLPSGVKWAKKNIDVTQSDGFAVSEYQYECSFFSWGNTDGHNPTSSSSFSPYSWGTSNTGSPYSTSAGKSLTGDIPLSQDAARVNLGGTWRMPTSAEFVELFNNIDYINPDGTVIDSATTNKLVTVNGIVGLYLKSKLNNNTIFFSCSGYGSSQAWDLRGTYGYFWSSSLSSSAYGRRLVFNSGGVSPQSNYYRFYGYTVRPVM